MGKPLTIKESDDQKLILLKKKTGSKSKVDVLRLALSLLEVHLAKKDRIQRWKKSARLVGESNQSVSSDFNYPGRFKDLP